MILFLILFCGTIGFTLYNPFIGSVAKRCGMTTDQFNGAFAFAKIISIFAIGRLADIFGPRPLLVLTLFGTSVSFALNSFFTSNAALLLLSQFLLGIFASNYTLCCAEVVATTSTATAIEALGDLNAVLCVTYLVGPVLTYFPSFGFEEAALIGALFSAIGAVLCFATAPTAAPQPHTPRTHGTAPPSPTDSDTPRSLEGEALESLPSPCNDPEARPPHTHTHTHPTPTPLPADLPLAPSRRWASLRRALSLTHLPQRARAQARRCLLGAVAAVHRWTLPLCRSFLASEVLMPFVAHGVMAAALMRFEEVFEAAAEIQFHARAAMFAVFESVSHLTAVLLQISPLLQLWDAWATRLPGAEAVLPCFAAFLLAALAVALPRWRTMRLFYLASFLSGVVKVLFLPSVSSLVGSNVAPHMAGRALALAEAIASAPRLFPLLSAAPALLSGAERHVGHPLGPLKQHLHRRALNCGLLAVGSGTLLMATYHKMRAT